MVCLVYWFVVKTINYLRCCGPDMLGSGQGASSLWKYRGLAWEHSCLAPPRDIKINFHVCSLIVTKVKVDPMAEYTSNWKRESSVSINDSFSSSYAIRFSLTTGTVVSKVLKMQRRLFKTIILYTKPKINIANLETLTGIAKSLEYKDYLQYLRLTDPAL